MVLSTMPAMMGMKRTMPSTTSTRAVPVEHDPADVERDRQRDEADAEDGEEDDRPTPAADHAIRIMLTSAPEAAYAASSAGSRAATFATLRSRTTPMAFSSLERDPADVELVPGEAVTGGDRVGVVVVVPALAEGQERDPPAVARVVARREAAAAPHVGRRVHQPRRVQAEDDAEEDAPEHHRPAADGEQDEAEQRQRDVVIAVEPAVERVGGEIGRVLRHQRGVVVVRIAEEDPPHVRPEPAVVRRVRIAVAVGVLVVDAMRRDPENRPALERQRPADGQEVLEGLRRLVAAMGVQPVVAQADAEADGEPVQHRPRRAGSSS